MRKLSIGLAALLISTSAYAQQGGADRGAGMGGRGGQGDDCCDRGNPVGSHQPKCRAPRLFRCCGGE